MEINKAIDEMLSEEKGLKKLVRKVVYKAVAPLVGSLRDDLYVKIAKVEAEYETILPQKNDRITNLEINIRNNNDIIKHLQNETVRQEKELSKMVDYSLTLGEEIKKNKVAAASMTGTGSLVSSSSSLMEEKSENNVEKAESNAGAICHEMSAEDSYDGIDYFDFENRFRGSREHIKKVQEQYLGYFKDKKKVVDIGCGRGEFLELLQDNNVGAIGIDLYGKSIECCKMMGLPVLQEDAISYLNGTKSVDGIFAGQLVEHLSIGQIMQLCETAYNKLEEGSYMVLETPNPTSLAIYTHAFYMDPSHVKPVHPLTLQYCAQKAGFKDVKIVYTQSSLLPVSIPKLEGSNIENLQEFNDAMEIVSGTLFGSQDYAIIAKK